MSTKQNLRETGCLEIWQHWDASGKLKDRPVESGGNGSSEKPVPQSVETMMPNYLS